MVKGLVTEAPAPELQRRHGGVLWYNWDIQKYQEAFLVADGEHITIHPEDRSTRYLAPPLSYKQLVRIKRSDQELFDMRDTTGASWYFAIESAKNGRHTSRGYVKACKQCPANKPNSCARLNVFRVGSRAAHQGWVKHFDAVPRLAAVVQAEAMFPRPANPCIDELLDSLVQQHVEAGELTSFKQLYSDHRSLPASSMEDMDASLRHVNNASMASVITSGNKSVASSAAHPLPLAKGRSERSVTVVPHQQSPRTSPLRERSDLGSTRPKAEQPAADQTIAGILRTYGWLPNAEKQEGDGAALDSPTGRPRGSRSHASFSSASPVRQTSQPRGAKSSSMHARPKSPPRADPTTNMLAALAEEYKDIVDTSCLINGAHATKGLVPPSEGRALPQSARKSAAPPRKPAARPHRRVAATARTQTSTFSTPSPGRAAQGGARVPSSSPQSMRGGFGSARSNRRSLTSTYGQVAPAAERLPRGLKSELERRQVKQSVERVPSHSPAWRPSAARSATFSPPSCAVSPSTHRRPCDASRRSRTPCDGTAARARVSAAFAPPCARAGFGKPPLRHSMTHDAPGPRSATHRRPAPAGEGEEVARSLYAPAHAPPTTLEALVGWRGGRKVEPAVPPREVAVVIEDEKMSPVAEAQAPPSPAGSAGGGRLPEVDDVLPQPGPALQEAFDEASSSVMQVSVIGREATVPQEGSLLGASFTTAPRTSATLTRALASLSPERQAEPRSSMSLDDQMDAVLALS
eukprot:TRINITY_DN25285_c0_g1_i1.p1 TRINITY_DN25285_c0_g1~~TRINITY_DN25285_c0_g1_i1.p1  ORF type:complete len:748 (+),score=172.59 TRINITY_DN25285_c0_g1_i1:72-2315(+)